MLPWRLQFDEDFPRPVVDRIEALGYHVRRLQPSECGRKDWEWLRWCREHDYVLCTCNVDEFRRHHHEWVTPEEVHCGVMAVRGSWTHSSNRYAPHLRLGRRTT